MNKQEQLAEQIADNPERFGMARLHLFNQLIDLRPKERELRGKLETAKNDKQKAFFQKALTNVQGWIEEFAAAYELLGEKPAAIVEAMGVQQEIEVEELINAYENYLNVLNDELNDLVGIASIHRWKSRNVDRGEEARKRISAAKGATSAPAKAVEAMDSLPAKKEMKWVKASEPPSLNTRVIGYFSDIAMSGEILYDEDGEWYSKGGKIFSNDIITHWMPLPEPPSESASSRDENTEGRV
jgi:hypothetical protein